jgi:hypothetical protein
MNASPIKIDRITVSSNSKEMRSLVEAVNATIRTETLALANHQGIENPSIPEFSLGELFQKYTYRCRRIRPSWFQHTFTIKQGATL